MPRVRLSRRALRDIEEIFRFSVERWGREVADRYLNSIEEALARLRTDSGLLRVKPEVSRHFQFYRVNRHFLICVLADDNVYVLAVKHGSLDLPNRLAEMEPHLLHEAELLHKTLQAKKRGQ